MATEIMLTKGKMALVDDADAARVKQYNWYAWRKRYTWYAETRIRRADGSWTTLGMHRLILGNPTGLVDHLDGDGLNNQRANLRACSHHDNVGNSRVRCDNSSGFKGVSWSRKRGRWEARIRVNGHRHHLGYYSTPEAAAHAYDEAAQQHFGAFARLNFPPEEAAA